MVNSTSLALLKVGKGSISSLKATIATMSLAPIPSTMLSAAAFALRIGAPPPAFMLPLVSMTSIRAIPNSPLATVVTSLISTGLPSSSTSKLSAVRSGMGKPSASAAVTKACISGNRASSTSLKVKNTLPPCIQAILGLNSMANMLNPKAAQDKRRAFVDMIIPPLNHHSWPNA